MYFRIPKVDLWNIGDIFSISEQYAVGKIFQNATAFSFKIVMEFRKCC